MIASGLMLLILSTNSSSVARPAGRSEDLSKSNSVSASNVSFCATGAGTGAGAATAAGFDTGAGSAAVAMYAGTSFGFGSHPAVQVGDAGAVPVCQHSP